MKKKIKKILINILCVFIPVRAWRNKFREKFLHNVTNLQTISKISQKASYGIIHTPLYNLCCSPDGMPPEIYNKDGDKMEVFFIRDYHFAHDPYLNCFHKSKYILWDRFNFGLDTHFYTHHCVLETMGNPSGKYAWFFESESIVPGDYEIFDKNKGLNKDFDLIFTHSEKFLNKYDNARFLATLAKPWYGTVHGGGILTEEACNFKTKNISIVSSNKAFCDLHIARTDLAKKLKRENKADAYGTFDNGNPVKVAESLTDYRYSIAIENEITPYWFTEKITNCFASMTVPIYLGATKIDEFFNPDGIIQVSLKDLDNIDKILAQCCEKDYEQRLQAIKDNYSRVQKYCKPVTDLIYEEYFI